MTTAFGLAFLLHYGSIQLGQAQDNMITRQQWGAKSPKLVEHFEGPSRYVVIHHSYLPPACNTTKACEAAMRSMQRYHQEERGWNDIGYSYAIGGDGNVYVGRGFNVVGAHAIKYNQISVGICLIGDWRYQLPTPEMLSATKNLIAYGIAKNFIDHKYKLVGHMQVSDTECPGKRLFDEISTWDHFSRIDSSNDAH